LHHSKSALNIAFVQVLYKKGRFLTIFLIFDGFLPNIYTTYCVYIVELNVKNFFSLFYITIFNLKYIMNFTKYISFLGLLMLLVLSSCKKISTSIYPKDAIKLELKTVNGQRILSWEAIKTSDFKKYQIFASSDSNFDVNKDITKIIGEINDAEKTTFGIKSFILDSLVTGGGNAYYKVAAVLQDRKLPSNVLTTTNDILFASNKYTYVNYFPKIGRMFLQNNQTGVTSYFDFNTKKLTNIGSFLNMASAVYGTDANNNPEVLATNNSGSLKIYNANTMASITDINYSNNVSVYAMTLVNGNVYVGGQDFSTGSYVIYVYDQTNNALKYSYNLANIASIMKSSDNGKVLYTGTNFGTIDVYAINNDGSLSFQGLVNNTSLNTNFAVNSTGSLFWPGNSNLFFDKNFNTAGIIPSPSFVTNVAFSENNASVAASLSNNGNIIVSVMDQATFTESSFIKYENTAQATISNIVPLYYGNDLYVMSTLFNSTFTSQTLVIEKQ
jgi:hypothetical protein